MSIVLDTSVLVAAMVEVERHHARAADLVANAEEDLVTTPLALAEMEHFARSRGGTVAQQALWDEFARGSMSVRWWADGLRDTIAIARERPDLDLTDASLVALAERLHTTRIATLDHRHFRDLRNRDGQPFTLLPLDG